MDLRKFLETERAYFEELEDILTRLDGNPALRLDMAEIRRFHYLYERVSSDLARISTFATEQDTRRYIETLIAKAYGIIHETRDNPHSFHPIHWFLNTFPRVFRKNAKAFYLSVAITMAGALLGGLAISLDPSAKQYLLPGEDHIMQSPGDRVKQEENVTNDRLAGMKGQGAAFYMTHNTQVSITTAAMGLTWGIGTIIMLFYTGIMVGGIVIDYILAGQAAFVTGWLLPHGSVEIPAILLAGQAGLMIANAMIGWRRSISMRNRFRLIAPELVTILLGTAVFLVWAGIIEAFFSQYHEPILPYTFKIIFGSIQLVLVILFLVFSGRKKE